MRMEKFEKEFVELTGVKVIIGKGDGTEYRVMPAKIIRRFTVCFRREMQWLRQWKWKKSSGRSGETLECRKHFGTAA